MSYLLALIALYGLSLFWISIASPWLDEQFADQRRWRQEQEELRRQKREREEAEAKRRKELEEEAKKPKIGDFERFVFPLVRRTAPSLIASQIVSVQPMTATHGAIFYMDYLNKQKELRTVLDDIVDALDDPQYRIDTMVTDILREVFKDCPYSKFYQPPLQPGEVVEDERSVQSGGQLIPTDVSVPVDQNPSIYGPKVGSSREDSDLRATDVSGADPSIHGVHQSKLLDLDDHLFALRNKWDPLLRPNDLIAGRILERYYREHAV